MSLGRINLEDIFFQHKNKLVNFTIVVLAMLLAYGIYQHQLKIEDALRMKKETEEKKNVVLKDIQQFEKEIQRYKNFVNNKDISIIMNVISEIAQDFSINVISIRPQTIEEEPLFSRHFFTLKLEANHYHDLGKFISRLESLSELYSVENLIVAPGYSYGSEEKWLDVELIISTILLKD